MNILLRQVMEVLDDVSDPIEAVTKVEKIWSLKEMYVPYIKYAARIEGEKELYPLLTFNLIMHVQYALCKLERGKLKKQIEQLTNTVTPP